MKNRLYIESICKIKLGTLNRKNDIKTKNKQTKTTVKELEGRHNFNQYSLVILTSFT